MFVNTPVIKHSLVSVMQIMRVRPVNKTFDLAFIRHVSITEHVSKIVHQVHHRQTKLIHVNVASSIMGQIVSIKSMFALMKHALETEIAPMKTM